MSARRCRALDTKNKKIFDKKSSKTQLLPKSEFDMGFYGGPFDFCHFQKNKNRSHCTHAWAKNLVAAVGAFLAIFAEKWGYFGQKSEKIEKT